MDRKDLLKLPPECRRAYLEKQAKDLAASGYNPEEAATVQPERTCETCANSVIKYDLGLVCDDAVECDSSYSGWQPKQPAAPKFPTPDTERDVIISIPKQPADTVQVPGEAEKVLMGDQYELIMSVRRLQDAHTREHFKGYLSPEQVEAKLKAERERIARELKTWRNNHEKNMDTVAWNMMCCIIAELEGKKP